MNKKRFNPDLNPVSFGRYIKAIRIQKGIELKTVSEELRVSLHHLSLIESEDHEELPDADFVKTVLRSYAEFIGLDTDDIIDRYEINRSAYGFAGRASGGKKMPGKKALMRVFLVASIIAMIGFFSMVAFYGTKALFAGKETTIDASSPRRTSSAVAQGERQAHENLVLTIDAVEETWIKINIDGEEPLEYLLAPKDHVELEADRNYHMLIGNAGGLKMKLNGDSVNVPGKSGEVVTLELPRQGKK